MQSFNVLVDCDDDTGFRVYLGHVVSNYALMRDY